MCGERSSALPPRSRFVPPKRRCPTFTVQGITLAGKSSIGVLSWLNQPCSHEFVGFHELLTLSHREEFIFLNKLL